MRLRLFGLAALFAACAAAQPVAAPIAELKGRVAGTPVHCVRVNSSSTSLRPTRDDGHILLWDSGKTIWVNHLDSSCGYHRDNDVLVLDQTGSSLCRGDIVRSFDRLSKIPGPSCVLNDFVPYTRVASPAR
jgi:hypothetical protein